MISANGYYTIFILLIAFSFRSVGQTTAGNCSLRYDSTLNRSYYTTADKMPSYCGGEDTLLRIIATHSIYSFGTYERCCTCPEGFVFVGFIIEADGKLTSKKIIKCSISDETGYFKKEALRILDYLTDWTPGQCNGENVAVQFVLPIRFTPQR